MHDLDLLYGNHPESPAMLETLIDPGPEPMVGEYLKAGRSVAEWERDHAEWAMKRIKGMDLRTIENGVVVPF